MIIYDKIKQRSDEWYAIKLGIPSASESNKILTPTGKLSSQSWGYMCQLIADKKGFPEPPKEPTEHMLNGIERESEARALFEFETGLTVAEVGFVTTDDGTAGCSPDGLIFEDGIPVAGFETKSPMAKTQISYLLKGGLPDFYRPQVHWSMAVTGLKRWWFMSYFPGPIDPLILPIEADDYTEKVKDAMKEFTDKLEIESRKLT